MLFSDDDDVRLAGESLQKLFARDYSFSQRQAYAASERGWSLDVWRRFGDAGLVGLLVRAADGGFDDGIGGLALLFWQIGAALALEPYLATLLALSALETLPQGPLRERLIAGMLSGEYLCGFADETKPCARWRRSDNGGYLLNGRARLVLNGGGAKYLIVAARESVDAPLRLFVVDCATVAVRRYRLHDGASAADLTFANTSGEPLGDERHGAEAVAHANHCGATAIGVAAAGAMDALLRLTLQHLKTRTQFGKPLAANQALQHRAATLAIHVEEAKSAALLMTEALNRNGDTDSHALSQGKYVIGDLARRFGHEALQLHGAIGLTEDYSASHYFRFLVVAQKLFGDTASDLAALTSLDARRPFAI